MILLKRFFVSLRVIHRREQIEMCFGCQILFDTVSGKPLGLEKVGWIKQKKKKWDVIRTIDAGKWLH